MKWAIACQHRLLLCCAALGQDSNGAKQSRVKTYKLSQNTPFLPKVNHLRHIVRATAPLRRCCQTGNLLWLTLYINFIETPRRVKKKHISECVCVTHGSVILGTTSPWPICLWVFLFSVPRCHELTSFSLPHLSTLFLPWNLQIMDLWVKINLSSFKLQVSDILSQQQKADQYSGEQRLPSILLQCTNSK